MKVHLLSKLNNYVPVLYVSSNLNHGYFDGTLRMLQNFLLLDLIPPFPLCYFVVVLYLRSLLKNCHVSEIIIREIIKQFYKDNC